MNIWLTADTHLGHANIIRYCGRPFSSVEEMDEHLIQEWNANVKREDVVYHLGDFCFKGDPRRYLQRLNGSIHLILGNHDNEKKLRPLVGDTNLMAVDVNYMLKINGQKIFMSHYPHRSWPDAFHGAFHAFGHVHGTLDPLGKSIDVGVDGDWEDFAPIHLDYFLERMKEL